MKRILPVLALAAVSSFAGGLKYGTDAAALLTMPSLSGSGAADSKLGFGGKVAGAAEYAVNEQLSVRGTVGYALTTWGMEEKEEMFGESYAYDASCTSQFLSLGANAVYAVAPPIQLIGGLGVDVPVSGTYESKNTYTSTFDPDMNGSRTSDGDLEDTKVGVFLEAGAGYVVNPMMSVNAKYRLALSEYMKNIKLNQIQVGVSYNFGN